MKNSSKTIDPKLVKHIANLAAIPIDDTESQDLADAFVETLEVVDKLQNLDTTNVEPTHQVTGLENRLREDEVDTERMFTQEEALANAHQTHNGYIVVKRILDN